jgi:hypothetical protein
MEIADRVRPAELESTDSRRANWWIQAKYDHVAPGSTGAVVGQRGEHPPKGALGSVQSRLALRTAVLLLVTALGVGAAITLPLLVSWWIATRPPVNDPPPSCPMGTNLYARSMVGGKMESTVYHCFRDSDERENTMSTPSP